MNARRRPSESPLASNPVRYDMPMTLPSFPRPLSLVIIRQMALFEEGDRENFFRVYDTFVPEQFRVMDLDAQKVEFWLQIYFAVFPALPSAFGKRFALVGPDGGADLAPGIAKLREYIETRGAEAARTEEFLPYYALPHAPGRRSTRRLRRSSSQVDDRPGCSSGS